MEDEGVYLNKKEPFCNLMMQNLISAIGEIDVKEKDNMRVLQ